LLSDAGYLPVFPRMIEVIVVGLLGFVKDAPLIYSFLCICLLAGVSVFWLLYNTETLDLKKRYVIWVILMTGGFFLAHSQMLLLLNISYYGAVLTIFLYMTDIEKRYRELWPWFLLDGLLIASKGTFLIFAPVLFIGFFLYLHKRKYKSAWFTFYLGIMEGLQLAYLILFRPDVNSTMKNIGRPGLVVKQSVVEFFEIMQRILLPGSFNPLVGMMLFFAFAICIFRYCNRKSRILFLVLTFCAGGQLLVNEIGAGRSARFLDAEPLNLAYIKNVWLVVILIEIMTLCVAEGAGKRSKAAGAYFTIWFCLFNLAMVPAEQNDTSEIGNWRGYASQMKSSEYAIPNNAYNVTPLFVRQNASVIHFGDEKIALNYSSRGAHSPVSETLVDDSYMTKMDAKELRDKEILAIYTSKSFSAQRYDIHCTLFDEYGNVLTEGTGRTRDKTCALGFLFEEPVFGCRSISFADGDGKPVSIDSNLFIAYKDLKPR